MSIEPGTYKITNVQSGLALHLSELDNKSVVANSIDDSSRQLWLPAPITTGGWSFESLQTRQSIGIEGALQEGVALVVGDPSVAKPWVIQAGALSSTLTYKISLLDSPYVVESPNGNTNPGTPVQLSAVAGGNNQLWQFSKIDD